MPFSFHAVIRGVNSKGGLRVMFDMFENEREAFKSLVDYQDKDVYITVFTPQEVKAEGVDLPD